MSDLNTANSFKTFLRARQDANTQETFSTVYTARTSKPILGEMRVVDVLPATNPYDLIEASISKPIPPPSLNHFKRELFNLAAKSVSELHSLRRRLASVYHPDTYKGRSREQAQIVMSEINSAIDAALDAGRKNEESSRKRTKK